MTIEPSRTPPRIILTRRWPAPVEAELSRAYDVALNRDDRAMTHRQLCDAFGAADAVCPTVTDNISTEVIGSAGPRLKIIGNFGVGYNHIDVHAARHRGLIVTNTPDVLTDCTADIAMALCLMVARRTGEGERLVRAHQWCGWYPTHMMGSRLAGKTLGIVGLGRIGRAVARRAQHGFGMRVIYHNRQAVKFSSGDRDIGYCESLEELLAAADFVSLHCPSGPTTRHMINQKRLALMKPSAYLINTSRGDVVDENALIAALLNGGIAGAGLDVYEHEPQVPAPLMQLENVVLLPHLGSATQETRIAMGMRVLENLAACFAGRAPPDRVA